MRAVLVGLVGAVLAVGGAQAGECRLDGLKLTAKADGNPSLNGQQFRVAKAMSHFWRIKSPSQPDGKNDGFVRLLIEGDAGRFYVSEAYSGWGIPRDMGDSEIATPENIKQIDTTKRDRKAERARVSGSFFIFGGPLDGVELSAPDC